MINKIDYLSSLPTKRLLAILKKINALLPGYVEDYWNGESRTWRDDYGDLRTCSHMCIRVTEKGGIVNKLYVNKDDVKLILKNREHIKRFKR